MLVYLNEKLFKKYDFLLVSIQVYKNGFFFIFFYNKIIIKETKIKKTQNRIGILGFLLEDDIFFLDIII